MSVDNTASQGLRQARERISKAAEKALGAALLGVIDDAQNEEPKPPIDTGHLRGSAFAVVGGDVVSGKAPSGQLSSDETGLVGYVGFDTPYAFFVHEGLEPGPGLPNRGQLKPGPRSEKAGGVGGLFLGLKLNRYRDRYAMIIASRLKKWLGGGST